MKCIHCMSQLNFNSFDPKETEGILHCEKCTSDFVVIDSIPIMMNITKYLENRILLGNELIDSSITPLMKSFLKDKISEIKNPSNDLYLLEQKWVKIYQKSKNSDFYNYVETIINELPKSNGCIEYGCSIGIMSDCLSNKSSHVFGIDKSFIAIKNAKLKSPQNVDYVVCDILLNPFENTNFDFIVAFNILELVEPKNLVDLFSKQIQNGILLMTDPYDYERGIRTVSNPLDEVALRATLEKCGFKISDNTIKPSFIPWTLEINSRTKLNYLCDLVIGKKN